jgi:protein-disulfide isomerase
MYRRFLVTFSKRVCCLFLLICLGCSAQLSPNELTQRIERQVRAKYNVPGDVRVIVSAPRASEFPSYDAITVTFDGQNKKQDYEFLVSKDQKTLIRMTKMDLTTDPYAEIMKKIDLKGRPIRGSANAKVIVVSYDDFECPFCSQVHRTLFPELLKEYGDRVAFIYKDFPLSEIHPWALHAAVDANCLGAQSADAYWDFADYIHSNQNVISQEKGRDAQSAALDKTTTSEGDKFKLDSAKLQACIRDQKDDAIKASLKEGEALGVNGTPTLFINGQMLDGARPIAEFRTTFDGALQQAGVAAPAHPPVQAAAAAPHPESFNDHSSAPH